MNDLLFITSDGHVVGLTAFAWWVMVFTIAWAIIAALAYDPPEMDAIEALGGSLIVAAFLVAIVALIFIFLTHTPLPVLGFLAIVLGVPLGAVGLTKLLKERWR